MNFSKNLKLLGDTLVKSDGSFVPTEKICRENEVLGLFYADGAAEDVSFCGKLLSFYENLKNQSRPQVFEVIGIYRYADEKELNEHFKTLPWISVPHSDQERSVFLMNEFQVQNTPALVFIDAKSCDVITANGIECVENDPNGSEFPWKTWSVVHTLSQSSLITASGERINFKSLTPCIKGIYFSAHWCPPCKAFTPLLAKIYRKLKKAGRMFEVIFVSSDLSLQSFTQYFSTMPWLAVPYEEQRRKELARIFSIGGIPSLVILDENNSIITKEGRSEINDDPEGEDFPWRPKLVDELSEKHVSKLNEEPCLILFTVSDEKELDAAHYMLMPVAEEYQARLKRAQSEDSFIPKLNFFYAGDVGICEYVRDAIQLDNHIPFLVILDTIHNQKFVYENKKEITTDIVGKFVRDYLSHKLPSLPVEL